MALTLLAILETSSSEGDFVAAVFPPWWSAARIFEAAGGAGEIAGVGIVPAFVIVHGNAEALSARLHSAGAFIVMNVRSFIPCATANGGRLR